MALFTLDGILSLLLVFGLTLLLGLRNIVALSVEARRAPPSEQADLRRLGVGVAIAMRVVALFLALILLASATGVLVEIRWGGVLETAPSLAAALLLAGGALTLAVGMKEVAHMLAIDHVAADVARKGQKSRSAALAAICLVNAGFSAVTAMAAAAVTQDFVILALGVGAAAVGMMALTDRAAALLAEHRRTAVLGFFLLTLIGALLLSRGAASADLALFGAPIEAMGRSAFIFVAAAMALAHLATARHQRKLLREKKAEIQRKT